MRLRGGIILACLFTGWLAVPGLAPAETRVLSDAECATLRQRLADHASLSEGVRRAIASQVAAAPVVPTTPAPAPVAAVGRADAIRARIEAIGTERKALEEQRLGALMKFDLSRASQLQGKIQQLDTEKAGLERELASAPAASPVTAPPTPAPTPPAPVADASRLRCQDVPASLETAVKIRQRELGAREGQPGVVPLVALKGQTSEQVAEALAAQLAPAPGVSAPLGLLDTDGDARLDGVVDVPAPGVFRLVRRRADGTLSVEAFATAGRGAAYGELTRRVDEATIRQTGQTLESVLASRPAGSVRLIGETGEFGRAHGRLLAGELGEAARIEGPGVRGLEYQNFRGETVRAIETIAPADGGVMVRRLVVVARPNENEVWDEITTTIRPVSYWRTDVQVVRGQESRTPAGAPVGTRSVTGPFKVGLER
jgi:hypothetical protein